MFRRGIEGHIKLVDQDFLHQARTFLAQKRRRFWRAQSAARAKNIRNQLFRRFRRPR